MKETLKNIKAVRQIYQRGKGFYLAITDAIRLVLFKLKGEPVVFSHYSRENNFGDRFNKDLLKYFNVNLIYRNSYKNSDMALTGSILQAYKRDFTGYIMGSGFLKEQFNRTGNSWNIRIIRGPLSAAQCNAGTDVVYADPGILASRIYPSEKEKKFNLGIIPHYKDHVYVKHLDFGNDVKCINVRNSPARVAREIGQCSHIASSSLHGLIFADAFQIPNIHIKFGDRVLGGDHKFKDYYFGMGSEPSYITYSDSCKTSEIISACTQRFSEEDIRNKQQEVLYIYKHVLEKYKL